MKRKYTTPVFECEAFELNASIASNCAYVIVAGPKQGNHEMCDGYNGPPELNDDYDPFKMRKRTYNVNFYDDTECDCYTTGGDTGYWNS